MRPKNNTLTLIFILGLLAVFLPCAVLGVIYHKELTTTSVKDDASACSLNLLGTCFNCTKGGYCGYATNYIKDKTYEYNFYNETSNKYVSSNGVYFFLVDSDDGSTSYDEDKNDVIVFNKTTQIPFNVHAVNNYGIGISGDYYIIIDEELNYSLFKAVSGVLSKVTDDEDNYDFIGVHNYILEDGKLDNTAFLVYSGSGCYLIDNGGNKLTNESLYAIYDYNDKYVVYKENNSYTVKDYDGNYFDNTTYESAKFIGKYLISVDLFDHLKIVDTSNREEVYNRLLMSDDDVNVYQDEDDPEKIIVEINSEKDKTIKY